MSSTNLKITKQVKQQEGLIVKRKKINRNRPKDNADVNEVGKCFKITDKYVKVSRRKD